MLFEIFVGLSTFSVDYEPEGGVSLPKKTDWAMPQRIMCHAYGLNHWLK